MKSFCLLALFLCLAAPLAAQTVINPTRTEFQSSPDHAGLRLDGTPILTSYELNAIGMNGSGAVALTVDLGKPAPDAQGKIVVAVPQLATLTANVLYTATVSAKGPDGVGVSAPSNPFGRAAPLVPRPAGKPALLP